MTALRISGSVPGAAGSSVPPVFVRPRVANGAMACTCVPFFRLALRSRRNSAPASSSGSSPTSSTAGAFSTSVKVTPSPDPAIEARKPVSSAECGRDRKSTSLVSRATRANFAYA